MTILAVVAAIIAWYLCREQRARPKATPVTPISAKSGFSYVKIAAKSKIVKDQGRIWQCQGTTNLPDGAILVAQLRYFNPVAATIIDQKNISVNSNNFQISFGEFRQKFLPGTYGITVYFSPQMQSAPIAATFCEDETVVRLGSSADYRHFFYARKQLLEQLFALSKEVWDKTVHDYYSAQKKQPNSTLGLPGQATTQRIATVAPYGKTVSYPVSHPVFFICLINIFFNWHI